jgi:hypothetical protein
MTFDPDHEVITDTFGSVPQMLAEMDEDLRDIHSGQPVEEVLPAVTEAVLERGIKSTPEQLQAYAEAISVEQPFTFDLTT